MSDREFEINGMKFKLSKMDAFKQLHIVRRLAPLLAEAGPALGKMKPSDIDPNQLTDAQFDLLSPILNGLSHLSDSDTNFILLGLCSCVEMQQMPIGNWAKVAKDSILMIQDLELPVLIQIAWRAFQFNLAGFFK